MIAENFSLAERCALLTDAELEEMAGRMARAEVVSSAYAGILLDEEQLKRELLQTLREPRPTSTPAAAQVRATAAASRAKSQDQGRER